MDLTTALARDDAQARADLEHLAELAVLDAALDFAASHTDTLDRMAADGGAEADALIRAYRAWIAARDANDGVLDRIGD